MIEKERERERREQMKSARLKHGNKETLPFFPYLPLQASPEAQNKSLTLFFPQLPHLSYFRSKMTAESKEREADQL